MKRVTLIVTGELEKKALHRSLEPLFPGVVFDVMRFDGFTSSELPAAPVFEPGRPSLVEKLADALIAAVDPGRSGTPADLAFLIDDLELYNLASPERAAHHLREAMKVRLAQSWPSAERRQRSASLVRERCSFHLLSPMIEAYFFGEPAALVRAGAKRAARVDPQASDLEDFTIDDPDYAAIVGVPLAGRATPSRPRHPKDYLNFLCDPAGTSPRAYRETKGGHEALRSLDWRAVLAPAAHVRFVRAFLADLADGLDMIYGTALFPGEQHPLTSRPARDNVLRNL